MTLTPLERLARRPICRHAFPLEKWRRWWLKRIPEGPLKEYYKRPFPAPEAASNSTDYLALDFETTGLKPGKDEILIIGFAVIRGHALSMAENKHYLVRPTGLIPETSAVIHGILDDHTREAVGLEEALPPLLQALAGRVMVAHHAPIEYVFLDHACRQVYGYPFMGRVVDTLSLERRAFRDRDVPIKPGMLRLANLRERYGLPRYRAHNALIDAISAAELLLAQIAHRAGKRSPRLKELTVAM